MRTDGTNEKDEEAAEKAPSTLLDWAGGEEAIGRMIDAFYDRVERDEMLSGYFPGGVSGEHRLHVTWWWTEVFGGRPAYSEKLDGYRRMVDHHRGLGITPEHRRHFVATMSVAADDAGLPDDPEFRSALLAYLEWGTRLAMDNSQPGADVAPEAPMPHWGWGEAPPYEG